MLEDRSMRAVAVIVMAILGIAALPASVAAGQIVAFNVTKTADTNDGNCNSDCSLREAITAANASPVVADVNIVNPGTYKLTRKGRNENLNATGDLDIRTGMRINGAGARKVIINGNGIDRVFDIPDRGGGVAFGVFIQDITITGGSLTNPSASGGGLEVADDNATVHLNGVSVRGNTAPFGAGIINGLMVGPTMFIDNSTISGNHALSLGGGIVNVSHMTITNSTISGNTGRQGAGLFAFSGDALIHYSTIAFNVASETGGGVDEQSGSVASTGSIIAKNTANNSANENCQFTLGSGGHNLENGTSCGFEEATDVHGNPKLAALGDYGGPTNTHKLMKGSLAINHGGTAGFPPEDQRGVTRPRGSQADIGAFEK